MTEFEATFVGLVVSVEFLDNTTLEGTVRAMGAGLLIVDDGDGETHACERHAIRRIVYQTPE